MKQTYFYVIFKNGDIKDFSRRCKYVECFGDTENMIAFYTERDKQDIIAIINISEIHSIEKMIVDEFEPAK